MLTIPTLLPRQKVDENKLSIQVTFYDKRNGGSIRPPPIAI